MISQDEVKHRLRYEPETGKFFWREATGPNKAGAEAGCPHICGYRAITFNGVKRLSHRLAWLYVYGETPPSDMEIDHINGDKADNRIENLRVVTPALNSANSKVYRTNKLGARGVYLDRRSGKFHARIKVAGKQRHLGSFASVGEAALAFRSAAVAAWGEHYRDTHVSHAEGEKG